MWAQPHAVVVSSQFQAGATQLRCGNVLPLAIRASSTLTAGKYTARVANGKRRFSGVTVAIR